MVIITTLTSIGIAALLSLLGWTLRSLVTGFNTRFDNFDNALTEVRADIKGVRTNLEVQIKDLRTDMNAQNKELRADIAVLREGQTRLREDYASLKEGQTNLKEGLSSLREDQASLREDQASLREGQTNLKEGLSSLREDHARLEVKLDGLIASQQKGVPASKADKISASKSD